MAEKESPADGNDDTWAFVAGRSKASDLSSMEQLRHRARPLAWAIAAVFVLGFITEVVAASRFVSELGSMALVIIYPLGSACLIVVALVQIKWIDRIPRDKAFARVTFGYAAAFAVALILIAIPATTVVGTGMVWLVADQLNFLLPLIVWSMVGDIFNAGEGRKVYPWVTSWQYVGQFIGLAIPALAPLIFIPLGIPLPWLLVVCPIGIILLGILLPRAMRGTQISKGHGRDESLGLSLASAWEFVGGVKAFRSMFLTSVLVFIAGMTLEASFVSSGDRILGSEAQLQILYGGTLVVVFVACGLLHKFYTTKLIERFNIPGSLMVLPLFAVVASIVMIVGLYVELLPILVIGIIGWWIPRWSIDDVARRTALAVVPDEKRARVSFIVDLVPFAAGLMVAGGVTWLVSFAGVPLLAPAIALPFALLAIIPARNMMASWHDALLDPKLRRRKRLSN